MHEQPAAPPSDPDQTLRIAIHAAHLADEAGCLARLRPLATFDAGARQRIEQRAIALIEAVRVDSATSGDLDAFLQEYSLASTEGVALLCLAEALLRIPDADTADRLIHARLTGADWARHLGQSDSTWVNASTWGLLLTGRLLRLDSPDALLGRLVARSGEPVVRGALRQAMRILAEQFVMGADMPAALKRSQAEAAADERFSYDMLGEAALGATDVARYQEAYADAIAALAGHEAVDAFHAPGVSVKLSALHPRLELAQHARVMHELLPRVQALALRARGVGIGLTLDAEESERLDLLLDVFAALRNDAELAGWDGLGIAVQAYQKRAPAVLDWLAQLAETTHTRIPVRLVKGAYWDSEIKRAQERGLADYPVYTRKAATDVAFIACARRLLEQPRAFYAQFATHNAHTLSAVLELAGTQRDFECQRLHGMGAGLYKAARIQGYALACRVYAPVGAHADLLPYLVRRLLENGANTSFVNRIADAALPPAQLARDPLVLLAAESTALPSPTATVPWGSAPGLALDNPAVLDQLQHELATQPPGDWQAGPRIAGPVASAPARTRHAPADNTRVIGKVVECAAAGVDSALASAVSAQPAWDAQGANARAGILEQAAALFEHQRGALLSRLIHEAGKCLPDALGEWREAIDYLRYYAHVARTQLAAPLTLPGPTGEDNLLHWHGRGVFACISPWNFPLAIFTGQVAAALAAGNAVIAKPAAQTPLVAALAVDLLQQAGVPADVLQFVPGSSAVLGEPLLHDPRLAGVAFTGSTTSARAIQRLLSERDGPLVPLIAETGGINAMLVDSSALPEQVVRDALASAFNSAGQRCSALRVLCLQAEIADAVIARLREALAELVIGDPADIATDIGPVIDDGALAKLAAHRRWLDGHARLIAEAPLPKALQETGSYCAPCLYEIDSLDQLQGEVFGPILHVLRYRADRIDALVDALHHSGYGLTLGIHSRNEPAARALAMRLRVGNVYINRNMIGAVVGVQPFGGEGLSGTGPKAGGPHYLQRFAVERTLTVNTAALGGNTTLLSQRDTTPSA